MLHLGASPALTELLGAVREHDAGRVYDWTKCEQWQMARELMDHGNDDGYLDGGKMTPFHEQQLLFAKAEEFVNCFIGYFVASRLYSSCARLLLSVVGLKKVALRHIFSCVFQIDIAFWLAVSQ